MLSLNGRFACAVACAAIGASALCMVGCQQSAAPAGEDQSRPSPPSSPAPSSSPARTTGGESSAPTEVALARVPQRGIQPQAVMDAEGTIHLVYLKGQPAGADVFYVRQERAAEGFSEPVRVNSQPGSAVATGTIRGAHMALGQDGRVHVVWFGSSKALPRGPAGKTPLLYARMNDAHTGFEPQRNLIQFALGLDGGGSVAADGAGRVYVTWHAGAGAKGEAARQVWVARSTDAGQSFSRETPAWSEPTGACGCCGMRAFADKAGTVYALYRSATDDVHRDMFLLTSQDHGRSFQGQRVERWQIATCPMSSAFLTETPVGPLAAWETAGQVSFARIGKTARDDARNDAIRPIAAPGLGTGRKHPVAAGNARGETILVWTEGTGWNRGGSLAWQVYDKSGRPLGQPGRAAGIPTWSFAAVFARPDGGFTIIH
jgi:hypothetical protein